MRSSITLIKLPNIYSSGVPRELLKIIWPIKAAQDHLADQSCSRSFGRSKLLKIVWPIKAAQDRLADQSCSCSLSMVIAAHLVSIMQIWPRLLIGNVQGMCLRFVRELSSVQDLFEIYSKLRFVQDLSNVWDSSEIQRWRFVRDPTFEIRTRSNVWDSSEIQRLRFVRDPTFDIRPRSNVWDSFEIQHLRFVQDPTLRFVQDPTLEIRPRSNVCDQDPTFEIRTRSNTTIEFYRVLKIPIFGSIIVDSILIRIAIDFSFC